MHHLHPEWTAFVAQNPNISHDDDQRNGDFLSSVDGHKLATQVSTTDITIPCRDDHQIPVRIYTAKETQSSRGVVIFFHSGAFRHGSLETEDVSCRYMALGGPITVISVEYRLCPAYLYPIPINDGWDAFQHIVTALPRLVPRHTEPVNLVISGTSSGGQLAAIVSQRARNWFKAVENAGTAAKMTLSGVLLRAPVTVRGTNAAFIPPRFRDMHHSWSADFETPSLDRPNMEQSHDVLGVPPEDRSCPDAYPLWGDFNGLPRTYVQICDADILRDDAVCYSRGLREAGVDVHESLYKDLPHIFWIYGHHLDVSKKAQEDCVQGLKWLLGLSE
ncbi:AB hydrolase superfamily protein [Fusarium oxysporum f. sp. rapae]|uniref:AB hydrolase superfamily protein n=1 Tax=Fusarium oxysporum f. sp. rapae TaxID=485398 RepID=A0A8J5NTQ4_FUSOX|nr:AB hydrolase superfamily protein [Fusarium oxysporum f. sp. rapae]